MHRRLALACSLAFTTIVTFGVIAVGAQIGLFSGGRPEASAEVAAPAPTDVPPATTEAPPPEPIVVTEYDYVDVVDPAPPTVAAPAAPKPAPTAEADPTAAAPKRSGSVSTTAKPTSAPPTSEPTEPDPEPEPTEVRREEPAHDSGEHAEDD